MIHCSGVISINGKCVTTDRGEHLKLIGNYHPDIGSSVWTDGVIAYGDRPIVGGGGHVSSDKLLPILCNNGSELLVFDRNFGLIRKYSCSKTDITAFCNIADYFAMGDINGNIYTSDGEEYNISKLGHFKSKYIANSIAISRSTHVLRELKHKILSEY